VDVVLSESAQKFVSRRGGTVYVSAHRHRCCTGPLTLLDASTDGAGAPGVSNLAEVATVGGVDVRWAGGSDRPQRLDIELRGRLRPHLVASWDGCAYRL
jgi:hypothetical protein